MCSSATYIVALMTIMWVPKDALSCFDENAKKLIAQHQVTINVIDKVNGKTFLDIWGTKVYTEASDCIISTFTAEVVEKKKRLSVDFHGVQKDLKHTDFNEKWTNVDGKGHFYSKGQVTMSGDAPTEYQEILYVFYCDDYVLGFIGCGSYNHAGYVKATIAILKDQKSNRKALQSLAKAETILNSLKSLIPNKMEKYTLNHCPTTV